MWTINRNIENCVRTVSDADLKDAISVQFAFVTHTYANVLESFLCHSEGRCNPND